VRDALERAMCAARSVNQRQGHQTGCRRHDGVAEPARQREARAVAPAFRKRLTPHGQHHARRADPGPVRRDSISAVGWRDVRDTMIGGQHHAGPIGFVQECVEDVACPVAVGKELSVCLFVQRHAEVAEERDCVLNRPSAKNPANDGPPAAPEVVGRYIRVCHVAPRAAADQDFGARSFRAVDQENGQVRVKASGENRGGQTGGSRAENGHVGRKERLLPVYAAGAASFLLTVEIAPHAPQRTLTRFGSSVMPIT